MQNTRIHDERGGPVTKHYNTHHVQRSNNCVLLSCIFAHLLSVKASYLSTVQEITLPVPIWNGLCAASSGGENTSSGRACVLQLASSGGENTNAVLRRLSYFHFFCNSFCWGCSFSLNISCIIVKV